MWYAYHLSEDNEVETWIIDEVFFGLFQVVYYTSSGKCLL